MAITTNIRTELTGFRQLKNLTGKFLIETDGLLYYKKRDSMQIVQLNNPSYKRVYTRSVPVVASALDLVNGPCDAISVNAAGTLTVTDVFGNAGIVLHFPLGGMREVRVRRITAITTSTNVQVYYSELVPDGKAECYLAELNGDLYYEEAKNIYYEQVGNDFNNFKFDKL